MASQTTYLIKNTAFSAVIQFALTTTIFRKLKFEVHYYNRHSHLCWKWNIINKCGSSFHCMHLMLHILYYNSHFIRYHWLCEYLVFSELFMILWHFTQNKVHIIAFSFHCNVLIFIKIITNNTSWVKMKHLVFMIKYEVCNPMFYINFSSSWCLLSSLLIYQLNFRTFCIQQYRER